MNANTFNNAENMTMANAIAMNIAAANIAEAAAVAEIICERDERIATADIMRDSRDISFGVFEDVRILM